MVPTLDFILKKDLIFLGEMPPNNFRVTERIELGALPKGDGGKRDDPTGCLRKAPLRR